MNSRCLVSLLLIAWIGLLGCEAFNRDKDQKDEQAANGKTAVAMIKPSKAATTQPSLNNVTGEVRFAEVDRGVRVVADIKGLNPNSKHGFHIHEKGDLSAPDLSSAGAHFNPHGLRHGGPPTDQPSIMQRHVGDLGNLQADANGNARLELLIPDAQLSGEHSIVGKSVIVHAKEDDLKTDPSGESGGRIAGGVIEMQK